MPWRAHKAGTFFLVYPTIRTLERLEKFTSVQQVLAACSTETALWTSCPRVGYVNGAEERYMEHEMQYGELALTCPDARAHHLDWRCDQPVRLLRNLMRLTAPNPGVMTGPGTNSYIVGDVETGYIVVDPGPDDAQHVERLYQATGGQIRMIVCTHSNSHADHSPGARPLQALCAGKPPIVGLASLPTARPASEFVPDRALADGERLSLPGAITHTLVVIHTPGHAANHLCLVMEEDAPAHFG